MQKMILTSNATIAQSVSPGKPTMNLNVRQPVVERKTFDPSSASPKGERYPIPSFFEYRMKPKEFDFL